MYRALIIIHLFTSLLLILVVICQSSKGSEMGAVFGGGASQTAFGSQGAGNFLEKVTIACAVIFMVTSLTLAILSSKQQKSLMHAIPPIESTVPGPMPVDVPVHPEERATEPTNGQQEAPAPQATSPSTNEPPMDTVQ